MAVVNNGWLHCKLNCEKTKDVELGLLSSVWIPFSIKLDSIYAYNSHNPFDDNPDKEALSKASMIYTETDCFIIDVTPLKLREYITQKENSK